VGSSFSRVACFSFIVSLLTNVFFDTPSVISGGLLEEPYIASLLRNLSDR
jgi:hypothetical protein